MDEKVRDLELEETRRDGADKPLEEKVEKLQNNSKDDLESHAEAALLNSGYACTFATDVQKIKAAMDIECEEKVKIAINTDPVEKQPESGHVLVPPAMFEENDSQAALITREKNQNQTCLRRIQLSTLKRRTKPAGTSGVSAGSQCQTTPPLDGTPPAPAPSCCQGGRCPGCTPGCSSVRGRSSQRQSARLMMSVSMGWGRGPGSRWERRFWCGRGKEASMEKTSVRILFGERKTKLCLEMRRLKKMMLMPLNILKIVAVIASLVMCYRSFKQLYSCTFLYISDITMCLIFLLLLQKKGKTLVQRMFNVFLGEL